MKNFSQKFIRFLITVFCLLTLLELASYITYAIKWRNELAVQWANGNHVILSYNYPWKFNPFAENSGWKERIFKKDSNKRPLAIVGCSFAEGSCLTYKQILGYKLSSITDRTVYQRGITATGLSYVYYQIINNLIEKQPREPEYIIYVFIFDHIHRLYQPHPGFWTSLINLRYEYKNGQLQEVQYKYPIVNAFYFTRLIQEYKTEKYFEKELQDFSLFKHIIAEMMRVSKQNYPNTKIVFLDYPQNNDDWTKLPPDIIKFIKDNGYIYIDANELTGKNLGDNEYKVEGEWIHPNEKAWDEVAPKLAKVLNL